MLVTWSESISDTRFAKLVSKDEKYYLHWPEVYQAMLAIKPECDHPEDRVVWKLQTYEYLCKTCGTVFSYDDLRKMIDDAPED